MKLIKSVKSGQLATIKAQWYELTHKKAYFVFCSTVLGREKMLFIVAIIIHYLSRDMQPQIIDPRDIYRF
jgi:hypothetical protein